ncbi:MAG: PTS sugar transporter subunit IIA [Erysipelotrichaceae bacterium]
MIVLSNRERQLVFYLYSKPYSNAKIIASIFSVSDKTIRNDIKAINNICNVKLIKSGKSGYFINEEHEDIIAEIPLSDHLDNENNQILLTIITNKTIDFFYLADKLSLSSTTLSNRLSDIKIYLQKYDLKLSRQKKLLSITGSSRDLRILYIDLIQEELGSNFTKITKFQSFFQRINITDIILTLQDLLDQYDYYIPEFYFNNLILNLCTILDFDYTNRDLEYAQNTDNIILKLSQDINDKLNKDNTDKTLSIHNCLIGVLKSKTIEESYTVPEFEKQITKITHNVFERYSLDIDISKFIKIFALHIHNMIIRCMHENSIQSIGGLSIKDSCLFIYDVAVSISDEIAKQFDIHINTYEISLISIHIGFAIENSLNPQINENCLRIVADIGQYNFEEQFLKKLKTIIPYDTEIVLSSTFQDLQNIKEYDLFITTAQIKNTTIPIVTCVLSPFLTLEDKNKLLDIVNVVLQNKRKKRISSFFKIFFDKQNFFVDTQLNQRDGVLNFLCSKLEEQGIVDCNFKTSVHVREAIASTDITNRYAIPHAMEFLARKSTISVFINPNGIQWGDSQVKIVFLSAINKQNVTNLRIIYDFIIDIVSDSNHFLKLAQAKNIEEFTNYLFE